MGVAMGAGRTKAAHYAEMRAEWQGGLCQRLIAADNLPWNSRPKFAAFTSIEKAGMAVFPRTKYAL
jgi:hypothetical protein